MGDEAMLVANFRLRASAFEHTDFRFRLSNLEAISLTWSVDLVVTTRDDDTFLSRLYLAVTDEELRPAVPSLLGGPWWVDAPWRRVGALWVKTCTFTVNPGATRSFGLRWYGPETGLMRGVGEELKYDGYAVLRLPRRRTIGNLMRPVPQLDRPARALIAAESVLRQAEWPPLAQRIEGYSAPRGLLDMSPPTPIYRASSRPPASIVQSLSLATGRAEVEVPPEGTDTLERIEVERTGAALVDRLERGEEVRGADGFDATDRLAAFLDEIASLGEDPNAVGAMNAFLAQQGSTLQLTTPADPNVPRRRRPSR